MEAALKTFIYYATFIFAEAYQSGIDHKLTPVLAERHARAMVTMMYGASGEKKKDTPDLESLMAHLSPGGSA